MSVFPPSLPTIRREAVDGLKKFDSFLRGLEQFGREPGEPWHALADEMTLCFGALEQRAESLKGKTSLPSTKRLAYSNEVERSLIRLNKLRDQLLDAIAVAYPSADGLQPPDEKSEALWHAYDLLAGRAGLRRFERSRIQRMLRRAHTPAAVLQLVTGHHEREDFGVWMGLFQGFQTLLMTTPLPRMGDKSLRQIEQEARKQAVTQGRDPGRRDPFFDEFVSGVLSRDREKGKRVRRELESLRIRAFEERKSPSLAQGMPESRKLVAVWDGVRAALDHSDPQYRRAALAALPMLQHTLIYTDFADEVAAFVVKGLEDTDAATRYKVMSFGHFFFRDARVDMPRTAVELERAVRALRGRLRRTNPGICKAIVKLLQNIDRFRENDRQWFLSQRRNDRSRPSFT